MPRPSTRRCGLGAPGRVVDRRVCYAPDLNKFRAMPQTLEFRSGSVGNPYTPCHEFVRSDDMAESLARSVGPPILAEMNLLALLTESPGWIALIVLTVVLHVAFFVWIRRLVRRDAAARASGPPADGSDP